jgi:hypothetical protein
MEYHPCWKRKLLGWSLLTLGVVGTVLPVLQGVLFLVLGLFVLRHQYLWAHRGMVWAEGRWPGAVGRAERFEARTIEGVRAWRDGLLGSLRRLSFPRRNRGG